MLCAGGVATRGGGLDGEVRDTSSPQAQVGCAAFRLPWGKRYALMVVIRGSRSRWATSTIQEEERQARGRTAMSRGRTARGGLDGWYHVPLLKDWEVKDAVPVPLRPMQLLVVDSSKEVPLILGWFLRRL